MYLHTESNPTPLPDLPCPLPGCVPRPGEQLGSGQGGKGKQRGCSAICFLRARLQESTALAGMQVHTFILQHTHNLTSYVLAHRVQPNPLARPPCRCPAAYPARESSRVAARGKGKEGREGTGRGTPPCRCPCKTSLEQGAAAGLHSIG